MRNPNENTNTNLNANFYSQYVMPVYTTRDNKEKILSPEFVNALKRAKIEKLAIVSFAGVTGAGKSTVINYLISHLENLNTGNFPREDVMKTSKSLMTQTLDLNSYMKILKIPDSDVGLLLIDTQGLNDLVKTDEERLSREKNIFIAMVASSVVVYFVEKRITETDRNNLTTLFEMINNINGEGTYEKPPIVLFRNQVNNLAFRSQDEKIPIDEQRKKFILEYKRSLNLKEEDKIDAVYFPMKRTQDRIEDVIDSNFYTERLDELLKICADNPKYFDRANNILVNGENYVKLLTNIINYTNEIKKINFKKDSGIKELLKSKYENEYKQNKNSMKEMMRTCLQFATSNENETTSLPANIKDALSSSNFDLIEEILLNKFSIDVSAKTHFPQMYDLINLKLQTLVKMEKEHLIFSLKNFKFQNEIIKEQELLRKNIREINCLENEFEIEEQRKKFLEQQIESSSKENEVKLERLDKILQDCILIHEKRVEENRKLTAQLNSAKEKNENLTLLKQKIDEVDDKKKKYKKKIQTLKTSIEQEKLKEINLVREEERQKRRIENFKTFNESQIEDLEKELKEKEIKSRDLKFEERTLQTKSKDLLDKQMELHQEKNQLNEENKKLNDSIRELTAQKENLEKEGFLLKLEQDSFIQGESNNTKLEEFEFNLFQKAQELEILEKKEEELKKKLNQLNEDVKMYKSEFNKREIENMKNEIERNKRKYDNLVKQNPDIMELNNLNLKSKKGNLELEKIKDEYKRAMKRKSDIQDGELREVLKLVDNNQKIMIESEMDKIRLEINNNVEADYLLIRNEVERNQQQVESLESDYNNLLNSNKNKEKKLNELNDSNMELNLKKIKNEKDSKEVKAKKKLYIPKRHNLKKLKNKIKIKLGNLKYSNSVVNRIHNMMRNLEINTKKISLNRDFYKRLLTLNKDIFSNSKENVSKAIVTIKNDEILRNLFTEVSLLNSSNHIISIEELNSDNGSFTSLDDLTPITNISPNFLSRQSQPIKYEVNIKNQGSQIFQILQENKLKPQTHVISLEEINQKSIENIGVNNRVAEEEKSEEIDDDKINLTPFGVETLGNVSLEKFASFSYKTKFNQDNFDENQVKLQSILRDLKLGKFSKMDEKRQSGNNVEDEECPIQFLYEVIKGKSESSLNLLKSNEIFNRLIVSFYLNSDEKFRTNFNNLFGKNFELPFMINYQDRKYLNYELINSNINCLNVCSLPLFPLEDDQDLQKYRNKFINREFTTNFVNTNGIMDSQFKYINIINQNNDKIIQLLLLNHNKDILNRQIESFVKFFDLLFLWINNDTCEKFVDLYKGMLSQYRDKLFVVFLDGYYGNEVFNKFLENVKNSTSIIIIKIDYVDDKINYGPNDKSNIFQFINTKSEEIKNKSLQRKIDLINLLNSLNSDDQNVCLYIDLYEKLNTYINNFLNSSYKNPINFNPDVDKYFKWNDFFNPKFLKQNFYFRNILRLEKEKIEGRITDKEKENISRALINFKQLRKSDNEINPQLTAFLEDIISSEYSFITKYCLFTYLLKEKFRMSERFNNQLNPLDWENRFSIEHCLREINYSLDDNPNLRNDRLENLSNEYISELVTNIQPFEVIDGDSLNFVIDNKSLTLQDLLNKNICIVCIVGVQSTGKSTIINNLFSVSFNTSQGRCSRGVYGSLIPIKDNSNFDYFLVLDTEGIDTNQNENNDLLTKRLLLFVLKVSHIVIYSMGKEFTKSFYKETFLSCNNYINYADNLIHKPTIIPVFNFVGSDLGDKKGILTDWNDKFIKEKLFIDNPYYFKEYCMRDVFDCLSPVDIPQAFNNNPFPFLGDNMKIQGTTSAFHNKICNLKDNISRKINDSNSVSITLDSWLKSSKNIWSEISNIKSLNLIQNVKDLDVKHKMIPLLDNCKKEILKISEGIENKVKDFKNSIPEENKNDLKRYIDKLKGNALDECDAQKDKMVNYFRSKLIQEFSSNYECNVPENLIQESVKEIEKLFKLVKVDFLLISYLEAQKELKYYLKIGTSSFQKDYKQIAMTKKNQLKNNTSEVEANFNTLFSKFYKELFESMDLLKPEENLLSIFDLVTIRGDFNFNTDEYRYLCDSKNPSSLPKLIRDSIMTKGLSVVKFLYSNKDVEQFDSSNFYNKMKTLNHPYVKKLDCISKTNKIIVDKKLIINNFKIKEFLGKIYEIFERQIGKNFWNKLFNLFSKGIESLIKNEIKNIESDLNSLGYSLDKKYSDNLLTVLKNLGNLSRIQIEESIRNQLKTFGNHLAFNHLVLFTDIPFSSLNYIKRDIEIDLNHRKRNFFEILNPFSPKNQEDLNKIFENGLKKYLTSLNSQNMSRDSSDTIEFEITKLLYDYVINFPKIYEDVDNIIIDVFNIPTVEKNPKDRILEYSKLFNKITEDPKRLDNIDSLNKYEREIEQTKLFSGTTLIVLFEKLSKILDNIDEGLKAYALVSTPLLKFFVYSYLIDKISSVSYMNFRLKVLSVLNEIPKNRDNLFKEFENIINDNYENMTKDVVNNVFDSIEYNIEERGLKVAEEKYTNQMKEMSAGLVGINLQRKMIEDKINLDESGNTLTNQEKEFFMQYLLNLSDIYLKEFDKLWKSSDQNAREDYKKLYCIKRQSVFKELHEFVQNLKQFPSNVFVKDAQEILVIEPNQNIGDKNIAYIRGKALYKIVKNYLMFSPQDDIITVEGVKMKFVNKREVPLIANYYQYSEDVREIVSKLLKEDETAIYNINQFSNQLIERLEKYKDTIDKYDPKTDSSDLRRAIELNYIGCTKTCPFCGRKCEQEHNINNNIHKCTMHQFRVYSGTKMSNNYPSFLFCDELQDDSLINLNGVNKTWKNVREEVTSSQKWVFTGSANRGELDKHKESLKRIWNIFGQKVCDYWNKEKNMDIKYISYDAYQNIIPKTHYILMLDYSGSMSGEPWNYISSAFIKLMENLKSNPGKFQNSYVSLGVFNHEYQILTRKGQPDPNYLSKISPCGGTNFELAFTGIYELMQLSPSEYEQIIILFMTDGESLMPNNMIEKITSATDIISKVSFHIMYYSSQQNMPGVLKTINERMKTKCKSSNCSTAYSENQVNSAFSEIMKIKV